MKRTRNNCGLPIADCGRRPAIPAGSTLVEVLMSILAMAIGLVMVATLFPVSIMRSINATKLTRGTIHRFNAESYVDLMPLQLVHDPDNNGNVREHFPTFVQRRQGLTNNYVVDPLGSYLVPGLRNQFGNGGKTSMRRYNAGFNQAAAEKIAISPDVWPKTDGFEDTYTVTAVNVAGTPQTVTLADVSAADLLQVDTSISGGRRRSRIVLFDKTGRFSVVREVPAGGFNGTTVSLATPLPATWTPGNAAQRFAVTTARIETRVDHFSWLLTVRNDGRGSNTLSANVDVVVFFKRQFTPEAEHVYALDQVDVINNNRRAYTVTIPPTGPRPALKKGIYLCDVVHGHWNRIQRVENETSNTPLIWLETNPPDGQIVTEAILMPGVVEVYPLGTK